MQDRKALQAGTSHFLGQNFSRAQQIKFQDQNGQEVFAWTTSWGVSTRLVGALVMTHGDDDGLVLPPRLAPQHVVMLPIYRSDEDRAQVLPYCQSLVQELTRQQFAGGPLRVWIDDRDLRGGEKNWQHIKRGVPLRVEVGPKDIAKNAVFVGRRDTGERQSMDRGEFVQRVGRAAGRDAAQPVRPGAAAAAGQHAADRLAGSTSATFFTPQNDEKPEIHGGFAICHWCEDPAVAQILDPLKVTIRCLPLEGAEEPGTCIFTGQPTTRRAVFAKAY